MTAPTPGGPAASTLARLRRRSRRAMGGATLLAAALLTATTVHTLGTAAAAGPAPAVAAPAGGGAGSTALAAVARARRAGDARRSSSAGSSRGRTGRRVAGAAAAAAAAAAARRRRRSFLDSDDEGEGGLLATEAPDFFDTDSDDDAVLGTSDDGGSLCFPATATLTVWGAGPQRPPLAGAPPIEEDVIAAPRAVAMADLRLGDTVLGAAGAAERVVLFSHRAPGGAHPFVALATAAGPVLTATAAHLVPVWSAAAAEAAGVLTRVGDVRLGDCLGVAASWPAAAGRGVCAPAAGGGVCDDAAAAATAAANASALAGACEGVAAGGQRLSPVVAVTRRTAAGLYAPHTPSGTLLVDGVVASAYTAAVPLPLARAGVAVAAAAARVGLLTDASGGHLFAHGVWGGGAAGRPLLARLLAALTAASSGA